jgi:uncharacterized protein (DUF2384 family)
MTQVLHSPRRKKELLSNIEDVIRDAEQWLKMPNDQLGGRRPVDMINASDDERRQVHDLIESIKHGMVT